MLVVLAFLDKLMRKARQQRLRKSTSGWLTQFPLRFK